MKVLRVIGNMIIGTILFSLIFLLTFTRCTKSFLEKDIILGVVKEKITESIKAESSEITDKSEELLDDMIEDDDFSDFIGMIINNYGKYQKDRTNYKVSDQDIEKIVSYASKYKSSIIEISGNKVKDISDEEFKKIFSSENINSLANEMFGSINEDLDDEIDTVIDIYNGITSNRALIILISLIVLCILLLSLINWSLYKWMIITGVNFLVVGIIISLIYVVGLLFNDYISSIDIVKKAIGEINLTGYLIWGVIEIVVGIILIVIYNYLKNKNDEEFKKLENL